MAARGQVSSGASVEGNADQLCNGTVARAASLHRNFVCYQRCSIALERWFIRHILAVILGLSFSGIDPADCVCSDGGCSLLRVVAFAVQPVVGMPHLMTAEVLAFRIGFIS